MVVCRVATKILSRFLVRLVKESIIKGRAFAEGLLSMLIETIFFVHFRSILRSISTCTGKGWLKNLSSSKSFVATLVVECHLK